MPKTIKMPKPRTEAQRAAARANGAKSNGPATPEGKAKSALNALRHGLAGSLVLTSESREKFEALLDGYLEEYQPQSQTENDLVVEMVAAKWQQQRCWTNTTALLDVTMDRLSAEVEAEFVDIDTGTRTALAFLKQADQSVALTLLNRYAARHGREYHRALDKLRRIQKERRESPQPNPPNEPGPTATPNISTPSAPPPGTGHAPQTTESVPSSPELASATASLCSSALQPPPDAPTVRRSQNEPNFARSARALDAA